MSDPTFRGVGFVEHIRARLWSSGATGRATVMIGAGFSRNARPSSSGAPPFPLLQDYRLVLADGLGLAASTAAQLPLERLASEYEASFGREALNDVIAQLIPWRQYHPGTLHQMLLNLPWADIFTTNYDTLLEETRSLIYERRYDLVVQPADLPTAVAPRIVKLHGSFPSSRPFIFTEEDFRRYPRLFAPFVNLVQQGMMEHTLCLLGFSGDDPNFLRWAGWVRDELGPQRPQIYLVGVLDLADGRRRYLENLGICPVDLSELFPWQPGIDPGLRHQQATEWFLRSLANGASEDRRRWPDAPLRPPAHHLPVEPLSPLHLKTAPALQREVNNSVTLANAYRYFRAQRLTYPGWELCPAEKREALALGTMGHFGLGLIEQAVDQPFPLDLLIAREGVWQLALRGEPLSVEGVSALNKIQERLPDSFPKSGPTEAVLLPADFSATGQAETMPWTELKAAWVALAFAQLTEAREDVDLERFTRWQSKLGEVVREKVDWAARWHWEGVRWSITTLDRNGALERLRHWPEESSDFFWEARRAAALTELGNLEGARVLNRLTLERIRSVQVLGQPDYKLLSQEGWLLYQARMLGIERYQEWNTEERANDERRPRLRTLYQYECDPWGEIRTLKTEATIALLKWEHPAHTRAASLELLPALRRLRLCEWSAAPLRAGMVTFGTEELTHALVPLGLAAPRLGILTAIWTGTGDALKRLLNKETLSSMDAADAAVLIPTILSAIEQAVEPALRAHERFRHGEFHFSYHILEQGLSALANLMPQADPAQRQTALSLAGRLGALLAIQRDSNFYAPLGALLHQTVLAMTDQERLDAVPALTAFPIPTGDQRTGDRWPEPFNDRIVTLLRGGERGVLPPRTVYPLLAQADTALTFERFAALRRLAWLYQLNYLSSDDQHDFAEILWRDRDEAGFPDNTPFHGFGLLRLPSPPTVDPNALLKVAVLNGSAFRIVDTAQGIELGIDGPIAAMHTDLTTLKAAPLQWAPEDVQTMLRRLQAWWPGMQQVWATILDFMRNQDDATLLLDVLRSVLLPNAQAFISTEYKVDKAGKRAIDGVCAPLSARFPF